MNQKHSNVAAGVLIALVAFPLLGAPTVAQQVASWTPSIVPIGSPAGDSGSEPQLTVSDRGVLLSWIVRDGSKMTLRFAERTAAGWTEPRTVATGDDWSINAMDVPSVLRLSPDTLAASWMQKSGAGMHSSAVRLSYSRDDGRTWARPFTPHAEGTPAERLFASLFKMRDRGLGLIWLEGGATPATSSGPSRTQPGHPPGAEHTHQGASGQKGHEVHSGPPAMAGGAMTVRFAAFDTEWKRTMEMPIDLRVCECCPTAAVVTADGVIAAYRNRSDGEIRDIYVSRFEQGRWSEPSAVYADNWQIAACPVNGPALSARDRNVAITWYTVKQDQGQAYIAFSRDAGRSFGTPIRLDDGGSLGRVDVQMLSDESALGTWIEFADGRGQFRARRVTMDGARSSPVTIAGLAANRTSGYPRVARHGDEVIFAWTEMNGNRSQVRTASTRVPSRMP